MLDEARRAILADGYRQALATHAPGEAPDSGLALIDEVAAEGRTDGPSGNPFARLVLGLAAAGGAATQGRVLAALRPHLVTAFAYAVPSDEALHTIVTASEAGPPEGRTKGASSAILEIGAGGGYWARCLADRGAGVTAFDRKSPEDQRRRGGRLAEHFPVKVGGPREALAAVPAATTLLLCWPPGLSNRVEADQGAAPLFAPMGLEALAGFTGAVLVFVGGFTKSFGSPAFFARLEADWSLVATLPIPNLGGWRDAVHIYRRRRIVAV